MVLWYCLPFGFVVLPLIRNMVAPHTPAQPCCNVSTYFESNFYLLNYYFVCRKLYHAYNFLRQVKKVSFNELDARTELER